MFHNLEKFLPPNGDEVHQNFDLPPLKVPSEIFPKVVEYCTHYQNVERLNDIPRPIQSHQLKKIVSQEWYYNFIIQFDQKSLFRLTTLANYLGVDSLLNLAGLTFALRVRRKNKDEVRKMLNVPSEVQVPSVVEQVTGSSSEMS